MTRLRVEHARSLLTNTSDPLEVVAERVGYSNSYAFSRAFFRETGERPGAYRRRARAVTG